MKKSKYSESQILKAIRENEQGVCRQRYLNFLGLGRLETLC